MIKTTDCVHPLLISQYTAAATTLALVLNLKPDSKPDKSTEHKHAPPQQEIDVVEAAKELIEEAGTIIDASAGEEKPTVTAAPSAGPATPAATTTLVETVGPVIGTADGSVELITDGSDIWLRRGAGAAGAFLSKIAEGVPVLASQTKLHASWHAPYSHCRGAAPSWSDLKDFVSCSFAW